MTQPSIHVSKIEMNLNDYSKWLAEWKEEHLKKAENMKWALKELLGAHPEIARIEAHYSGSCDEGYINEVDLLNEEGGTLNQFDSDPNPYASIEKAVINLAYEFLEINWPGWETCGGEVHFNGEWGERDGASGTVTIDPFTMTGSIEHQVLACFECPQPTVEF